MKISNDTRVHPRERNHQCSTPANFHTRNYSQDSATSTSSSWTMVTQSNSESDIDLSFSSHLQDEGLGKRKSSELLQRSESSRDTRVINSIRQPEVEQEFSPEHPLHNIIKTPAENQEDFIFDMSWLNLESKQTSHPNSSRHMRQDSAISIVCNMKYDGCYYTGEIDDVTQSPNGSGTMRSKDGAKLKAEWTMGSCTFDV